MIFSRVTFVAHSDVMDGDEAPIRQGFLCPFCFRDMREPRSLQNHVFEVHPENKEAVEIFKGLLFSDFIDCLYINFCRNGRAGEGEISEYRFVVESTGIERDS